jgi:hypothetical protein
MLRSFNVENVGSRFGREHFQITYIHQIEERMKPVEHRALSLHDWPQVIAALHHWIFDGIETH